MAENKNSSNNNKKSNMIGKKITFEVNKSIPSKKPKKK